MGCSEAARNKDGIGMHTNGPDYTMRDIRRAIVEWLRADAHPDALGAVTQEQIEALVRRIRPICKQPQ